MWTVAAANKKYSDALGTYNSLNDPHLHQYFRKPKVRNHMIQAGLMTSEGKVIPEAVLRLRKLEEERRKQLHQLLNEVLEKGETNRLGLKRLHETRDLESEARHELVQRAKQAFQTSNSVSTGQTTRTQSNVSSSGRTKQSYHSMSSMSWLRRVVQIRPKIFGNKKKVRVNNSYHRYQRPKSSYGIRASNKIKPDFNTEEELNEQFSDILSLDGESIRDSDSDSDVKRTGYSSKRSKPSIISLRFNGLTTNCMIARRVQISQQLNSGGNAITIYDRMVSPGETFNFSVRPHGNRPFCITVLIDGIRDLRVSTCCEQKHKMGSKMSHFTLVAVSSRKMCANCKEGLNSGKSQTVFTTNTLKTKKNLEIDDKIVSKISDNKADVVDSDVEECQPQGIEETKHSSKTSSSSPNDGDYNEEQFDNYDDSEFEIETPDSLRIRTNSNSSDDNNPFNGHKEVVEAEIHNQPDPDDVF